MWFRRSWVRIPSSTRTKQTKQGDVAKRHLFVFMVLWRKFICRHSNRKQKKLFYNSLLSAVKFGSAPAASGWERRAKRCQSHQHIKQKRLYSNSLLSVVKFGSAPAASRRERRALAKSIPSSISKYIQQKVPNISAPFVV